MVVFFFDIFGDGGSVVGVSDEVLNFGILIIDVIFVSFFFGGNFFVNNSFLGLMDSLVLVVYSDIFLGLDSFFVFGIVVIVFE